MTIKIESLDQMAEFARNLAHVLPCPSIVLLQGDLGAGKTALARFLIQSLMGQVVDVPSPTFTLVQSYETLRGPLYHYDLYRIKSWEELLELGIEDTFFQGINLVEWPDRLGPLFPQDYLEIQITLVSENVRMLACEGKGQNHARLLTSF